MKGGRERGVSVAWARRLQLENPGHISQPFFVIFEKPWRAEMVPEDWRKEMLFLPPESG